MASASNYTTQQQKNGFKLQLLREKNEEYLLNLFHKTFSTDPTKLNAELQKHQGTFKQLLKGNILKQKQYDLLFPTSQQTDSQTFDVTLLFLLIRRLCGYKKPPTGWNEEPDVTDTTEIANAIRLKLGRNRIQHGKVSISTPEYNSIYRYLRQPLLDLGCPKAEIDNLMVSFRYDLPAQNADFFVGREVEIDKLNNILKGGNNTKLAAVVSGIPGIGKSELARQYCHQNTHNYDHIIWINAESNLESTYLNISKILKLHDQSNTKVIAKLLEEYFKDDKVLFIFDNCTDIEILSGVLFSNHDNIITTQIKHWANCYEVIPLDVWTPENSLQYLKKCMNHKEINFKELIEELGNHPLGIQHAVAFIGESKITLNEYLRLLKDKALDVLSEKVALDQGLPRSVLASFLINITKLKRDGDDDAFELLSIMAVLDGSFMSEEYLKRLFGNEIHYVKAKKVLLRYSMVQYNERNDELTEKKMNYLTIHSLYQLSMKHYNIEHKKSTLNKCFRMMAINMEESDKKKGEDNKSYCLIESTIWGNQFEYLQHDTDFQDILKNPENSSVFIFLYQCILVRNSKQIEENGKMIEQIRKMVFRTEETVELVQHFTSDRIEIL